MNLSATELDLVTTALAATVLPGLVQRIVQPSPTEVLLGIYGNRELHWLLLDVAAGRQSVLRLPAKRPAPERPPRFCLLLRHHLDNARLVTLEHPPDERRLLLGLTTAAGAFQLEARLFGNPGELLLWALPATPEGPPVCLGTLSGRPARPLATARIPPAPASRFTAGPDLLEQVRECVEADRLRQEEVRLRAALLGEARAELVRRQRRVDAVAGDLARVDRSEQQRRQGELLRDSFHLLRRGQALVRVVDYRDPELGEVEIPLDPSLSPAANVERCFKRHKALQQARAQIEERLAQARAERDRQARRLEALEAAPDLPALTRLAGKPGGARGPRAARQPGRGAAGPRPRPRGPTLPAGIREIRTPEGHRILVGKGDRENDQLTFKIARGNDTWLHVRDLPGPHVVLQPAAKGPLPERALLDAALLAVHYCRPARAEGRAEVLWTQVKNLRRAGKPGQVYVAGGRSLLTRLDEGRIATLLERGRDEDGAGPDAVASGGSKDESPVND